MVFSSHFHFHRSGNWKSAATSSATQHASKEAGSRERSVLTLRFVPTAPAAPSAYAAMYGINRKAKIYLENLQILILFLIKIKNSKKKKNKLKEKGEQ